MTPHRVLSVIPGPLFGGAHNQLIRLHAPLAEAGFEAVAAVPPEAEEAARRIEAAGIEVVRVEMSRLRGTAGPLAGGRSLVALRGDVRRLRRVIRQQRADLVQVHGVINLQPGIAAGLEDVAVVWQLLDTRAPLALRRLVMPLVTRIADAITSWGRAVADAHPGATRLGERLICVYPPIDPELRPDAEAAAAARRELSVAAGAPLVGTLGVRQPQKGHEYFVRAAAIVARAHPEARFRVIGAPSRSHAAQMAAIEREAEQLGLTDEGVLEFVDPGARAVELLQALDVFALTSWPTSEGMPTAILEAMACAKPVVSVDVGAVRELVDDGDTGVVVAAEDAAAIATAIMPLLGRRAPAEAMGRAGRERAVTEFGLGELAQRHARAYRLALGSPRRR